MTLIGERSSWAGIPYSEHELRAVEKSDEAKIRELRSEEITQLRIAIGRRSPIHRRADLYFRLAEIYLEAYREEFLLEGRVHEQRLERGVPDKFIDRSSSKPFITKGIKACEEILHFGIQFDKLDQVYYFLGFYYGEMDDRAASSRYFKDLVDRYPNSIFSGPAAKELGENFLRKSDFRLALKYFQIALHKSSQDSSPPILHKLAWCYYRIKDYDQAISIMKDAISKSAQYGNKFLPLKDECLRDMAVIMTERGNAEEAIRYFQEETHDAKLLPQVLEKLGTQYERNVELSKAIAAYDTLLKAAPESDSANRVWLKLVELEVKQGHHASAIQRMENFSSQGGGKSGGSSERQSTLQNMRVLSRKMATDHHQHYRKKHVHKDLEIAEAYYTAYLNAFLKNEDPHHEAPEIKMYLAEVRKTLGKSKEVAELYRQIVESHDSKDTRYAKEAGLLWTSSLLEVLKKAPPNHSDDPSETEKEFVEASDLMQASMGDTPAARESALRVAQVLAGYKNTHPDAVKRIRSIIDRWPNSQQALTAARLWIQLSKDFEEVLKVIRGNSALLAADRSMNQGKLQAFIEDQDSKAKVGVIAKYENDKDYIAAAKGYEDFAESTKDHELAEKAYANAVGSYLKMENRSEPILQLLERWTKRYPRSIKAMESLRVIGTHALIQGDFELSAQIFQRLGAEFRDPDSLETSARLYEGSKNLERAQQEWSRFLDLYRSSPNRWRVALALARSQEASHLDREASHSYRTCATGPVAFYSECNARLADLYARNKDFGQAKELYRAVISRPAKRGDGVSPFVGYARFKLAEMTESNVIFEPLRLPEKQLQSALSQRLNFLEPLSKSYQSVVQSGGTWGVAALHRLALFAIHFADEVDAIEPPPSAKGASLEKFRRSLSSISQPLREKAKSTWNEGYSKAVSINLFSPVLPEVADHLADFQLSTPARAQGPRGKFHLAGLSADGGPDGQVVAFQKVKERLLHNTKEVSAWIDYGNLLWGDGKPSMAKVAYQRALALNPQNALALNNLAVVQISSEGEEDWVTVIEGAHLLEEALRIDDFFIAAKINLATLMNYYRLFQKAKPLWDQVLVRNSSSDAWIGLAISLQGLGNFTAAESAFQKAKDLGGETSEFARDYNEAARASIHGTHGASRCESFLNRLDAASLVGFERSSLDYLKGKCEQWRHAK